MARTRILIADDHKMFAQGLRRLLENAYDLVETVGDGQALIDETERLKPDVILVDISMPVLNGLEAVRRLNERGVTTPKIIFLTMHANQRMLAEAFRCGANGYVLKQSAGDELIFAIEQTLAGHEYVTPSMRTE
jgi:DNA-binding NarL/FixJ family response regulator